MPNKRIRWFFRQLMNEVSGREKTGYPSVDPCFNFLFFQQDRHTVVVGSHAAVGRSCQDREAVLIAEAG